MAGPTGACPFDGVAMVTERDEPPAMEDLAKRYLDLWQDQWAAVCADPTVADSMARTMTAFGQTALTINGMLEQTLGSAAAVNPWADLMTSLWPMPAAAKGAETDDQRQDKAGTAGPETAAPGATPLRPASGDGDGDLAELAGRIAALERELATLAPDGEGDGGKPAPGPAPAARRRRRPVRKSA
ncbi:hypothetical protein [Niveispirillum lacus]|uniref:hypothetical protein n=1 Tax=Niveispirillum lacus TaxID=1981099 RepID=UPI001FEBF988|nr:hypothetical protein [Niveispirillum lacus]